MSRYLYAVRCNFLGSAAREAAWNDWYNGPKLHQMLALPHFLSMQRFAATALDTPRKYLALWLVDSAEAFATPEYRAQWGFADWTQEIGDWNRDLYRAQDGIEAVIGIAAGARLYLAAADGMDEGAARAAVDRAKAQRPEVTWLESAGLDRHSPVLGLAKLGAGEGRTSLAGAGLAETLFTALTEQFRAPGR